MIPFANPEVSIQLKQSNKERFVFVVQLKDGRFCIGSATNPAKRIAALNTGHNPAVKKALQVARIVGIKELNDQRNEVTVFHKFEAKYGAGKVLSVWLTNLNDYDY